MSRKPIYQDLTPKVFKSKKFKELRAEWNKKLGMSEEPRRLNREFTVYNRLSDKEDEGSGIENFSNEDLQRWPKGTNAKYEELQHDFQYENETEAKIMFLYVTYHPMFKRIAKELGVSVVRVKNVVRRVLAKMKRELAARKTSK